MNTVAATRTVSAEATLLDFAAGIDWTGLPQPVRAAVSTLVADALGNAVSGRGAADVPAIESVSRALYGDGGSPIIAGGRASPLAAAGINAFQMTAHTMCDVYRPGLCHVTPEVVPAALATAVEHGATPTRFLAAVTAGLEITTRICTAMNYPAFRARG
ncbi:MAG TPA: MmgE/PrpD family protein, partial [Rugosimonospora sp.]|nr:MmgE/PrpD family protein [Rugosimonospora sp.]